MCHNVSVPCRMTGEHGDLGMGAISRMQVVVRCERVFHLDLCTLERQSLCESHRQRRWLTCWSYVYPTGYLTFPLDKRSSSRLGDQPPGHVSPLAGWVLPYPAGYGFPRPFGCRRSLLGRPVPAVGLARSCDRVTGCLQTTTRLPRSA